MRKLNFMMTEILKVSDKFDRLNAMNINHLPMNSNLAEIAEQGYGSISDDIYRLFDNAIKVIEQVQ